MLLCFVIQGGYLAGSLAVSTDAAHLLTDMFGFSVSLAAIQVAVRPASNQFCFGWLRAGKTLTEVMYFQSNASVTYRSYNIKS